MQGQAQHALEKAPESGEDGGRARVVVALVLALVCVRACRQEIVRQMNWWVFIASCPVYVQPTLPLPLLVVEEANAELSMMEA